MGYWKFTNKHIPFSQLHQNRQRTQPGERAYDSQYSRLCSVFGGDGSVGNEAKSEDQGG